MKWLLILAALVASFAMWAAPHRFRRPCRSFREIHSRPVGTILPKPTWKTIAAGGAAVGTVVAAYKISNGVEEGVQIVAHEHPFFGTLLLAGLVLLVLGVVLLPVLKFLYRTFYFNRKDNHNENQSN